MCVQKKIQKDKKTKMISLFPFSHLLSNNKSNSLMENQFFFFIILGLFYYQFINSQENQGTFL